MGAPTKTIDPSRFKHAIKPSEALVHMWSLGQSTDPYSNHSFEKSWFDKASPERANAANPPRGAAWGDADKLGEIERHILPEIKRALQGPETPQLLANGKMPEVQHLVSSTAPLKISQANALVSLRYLIELQKQRLIHEGGTPGNNIWNGWMKKVGRSYGELCELYREISTKDPKASIPPDCDYYQKIKHWLNR